MPLGAISADTQGGYSTEELHRRMIERRAVEAAIWGMPIVSVDAMREAYFRDAKANYNDIVFWSKPADWKNQTTTPNASTRYVYFNLNTNGGPVVLEVPRRPGGKLGCDRAGEDMVCALPTLRPEEAALRQDLEVARHREGEVTDPFTAARTLSPPSNSAERSDFSLVLGGPLFQLFRRAHLTGDALEMSRRRVMVIAGIAWLPLLLLSLGTGRALGDAVAIPFLLDVETHVRFLIALPMLIAAELIVHRRLLPAVRQFVERRIVTAEELPKFEMAVESTMRLRNSVLIEVALLVFVCTMGIWVWRNQITLDEPSWYALPDVTGTRLTPAGYWLMLVSTPIFQFILLRWYFRFFLWFMFLFRVARLNLHLIPIHTDRTGGLGFLGASPMAFAPVLMAQGAVLAGVIASRIFYAGQALPDFKVQIVGFVGFFVLATLIPLTVFAPRLAEARRAGLGDAGRLASRYGRRFEEKWFHRGESSDEELLGSGDIQSLADLGNSMGVVHEMRLFPFGWRDVTRLVAITATPFFPLLLTIFSLEDFATYLIKIIF